MCKRFMNIGQRPNLIWIAGLFCLSVYCLPMKSIARNSDVASGTGSRIERNGDALVLNGSGVRQMLFMDIYQAALYLPYRLNDPRRVLNDDIPLRLRITLLRDVSTLHDLDALLDGLEANNSVVEMAAIQAQLEQFLALLRKLGTVSKGSVVELDYQPDGGTRVWLNRRLLGAVPGMPFNRSLLRIWLGEQPIQSSLKRALLGGTREAL
jgi:long-chain acyl-CoA synthetase